MSALNRKRKAAQGDAPEFASATASNTWGGRVTLEIERRFLASRAPLAEKHTASELWQAYIVSAPNASVRIRAVDSTDYSLSIKRLVDLSSTLVRDELEIRITVDQFRQLQEGVVDRPIEKRRYRLEDGGHLLDVDVFRGHLTGLVIAEVEFESIEASREFDPPSWLDAEITEDRRFLNSELVKLPGPPG
jgi:adenylate cyclase